MPAGCWPQTGPGACAGWENTTCVGGKCVGSPWLTSPCVRAGLSRLPFSPGQPWDVLSLHPYYTVSVLLWSSASNV